MKHTIALLAAVYSNSTALEAVNVKRRFRDGKRYSFTAKNK